MKKIAVIGAGITGITTAYQLMKKGYDVTVFDKQKYAAMETSYANGGQPVSYTHLRAPRDKRQSRMPSSA